jgi:quercetin dioxygenase-like cupin family protein
MEDTDPESVRSKQVNPFLSGARSAAALVMVAASLWLMPSMAAAQQKYIVKPIAEMKVKQLPAGELFWRVESFPTLDAAKAAAPPYRWNPNTVSYDGLPSLAAEAAGKAWLFTLGPKGGSTAGGTQVAEIGPVPPLSAPEYLLRVNEGHGPAGSTTPVHMHPGSETFYVIYGRLSQRTPQGVMNVEAGQSMNGHPAGTAMQVSNSGTTELEALIMFVVDATKPFSTPTKFQ